MNEQRWRCVWSLCLHSPWSLLPIDVIMLCIGLTGSAPTHTPGGMLALSPVLGWRLGLVTCSLLHEWAHWVLAVFLRAIPRGPAAGRDGLLANLLGHQPLSSHVLGLLPFAPDRRGVLFVRVAPRSARDDGLIRRGGWVLGCIAAGGLLGGLNWVVEVLEWNWGALVVTGFAVGALLSQLAGALTDLTDLTVYSRRFGVMACGNVTLLASTLGTEVSVLPRRLQFILHRMLEISQMRGAQAGGGALLVERHGQAVHVVRKRLNRKRADLAEGMMSSLRRAARWQSPHQHVVLAQTHVRYATAGRASLRETHPHSFFGAGVQRLRRVTRHERATVPQVALCSVQTTLTHNGDLDGFRFRGVLIPYPELGQFLAHVLGTKNHWTGDSPLLAGCIELFFTQGRWEQALALAFQQVVAGKPPDFSGLPLELSASERAQRVQLALDGHARASDEKLQGWAHHAEAAFEEVVRLGEESLSKLELKRAVSAAFLARLTENQPGAVPAISAPAFAHAAVTAFFDNDLYIALRKLEPCLEGTFGCVVTSSLEPRSLIAFSRGQPLSLGFLRKSSLVCVVSERSAIKVMDENGQPAFDERLDLDLCAGEIARVKLNEAGVVHLTLYGVREGRERDAKELAQGGRLVSLLDNPHVSPLPSPSKDELKQDILDTPGMVADVRKSFQDETSENSRTAQALLRALLTRTAPRVLVLGITSELWLAEQFVHNLAALFPRLAARAVSSNAVLLATAPWDVDENTIVLAVSQTGQDFPTLGALVALMSQRPQALDAFFVLTGQVDTLMGQAVGQSFARGAPFSERILVNQTGGFRPSEAQFSTLSATHATLSELVLWLARRALDPGDLPALSRKKSLETRLTRDDLEALEARRDASILSNIPSLVTAQGGRVFGGTSNEGAALVRRFRWHVLEGLVAFAGAVGILELNLRGHAQVLPSALLSRVLGSACAPSNLCGEIIGQLDVLFYAFLAPLFVWLLRAVQGRPLLHRQGPRELLIGDTETNHKILWLFARKLFGLSYGFASIKPYSANHQDELIMTHEPVRGCLVLLGLVDLRHEHLKTQSHAAFMTAKQLINSRSVAGSGAEIVTVGHAAPPGFDARFHVTLPNAHHLLKGELAERLCEGLYDSWERLIGMQLFLEQLARGVARLPWYDRFKTKDRVYAPTTASPVSAAAVYQALSRTQERYVGDQLDDLPFEVAPSSWRGSGVKRTTTFWREETGE